MQNLIIGTAGHIDHGKTSLIEALTGYFGDETKEEKERGITIDLSYSNMQRESKNISFIDVPGHEKLVKNMVSGAFSFDAALIVIAANDGIMPQTIEHIKVLNIVGLKQIIIALNKSDLADSNTLEQRAEEIEEFFKEYPNFEYKIIPTSIYDEDSIENLKEELFSLPPKEPTKDAFFRYYIDRIFSPKGIGTVTTGTVLNGEVKIGDKLNIAELNKPTTVKAIQIHAKEHANAHSHQRVALNLDINYKKLQKGYLLCSKGYFRGFNSVDVAVESLSDTLPKHGSEIVFVCGAKRLNGNIYYYPESNFAQIKFNEKIFVRYGDSYIILNSGRVELGGNILAPVFDPIRKKDKVKILKYLEQKDFVKAFEQLTQNHKRGFGLISSYQRFGINHEEAIKIALNCKDIFIDEKELVLYPKDTLDELYKIIKSIYENNQNALLSPNSINNRIKWASSAIIAKVLNSLLTENYLQFNKGLYYKAGIKLNSVELELEDKIYNTIKESNYTPPAPQNIYSQLDIDTNEGKSILNSLVKRKKIVKIAHNIYIDEQAIIKIVNLMKNIIKEHGFIDIKKLRENTDLSRKYCIAYLEYLDNLNDIVKDGDKRKLKY